MTFFLPAVDAPHCAAMFRHQVWGEGVVHIAVQGGSSRVIARRASSDGRDAMLPAMLPAHSGGDAAQPTRTATAEIVTRFSSQESVHMPDPHLELTRQRPGSFRTSSSPRKAGKAAYGRQPLT